MELSNILTIIAILLAPVIAVSVGRYLASRKEERESKLWIFRTLMATRATRMSHEHIRALNMIDVSFYGDDKKSKNVIESWKVYLDNLAINTEKMSEDALNHWSDKNQDLLIDLLQKMALSLDYNFDKTSIKNTSYFPRGHELQELDQLIIRKGMVELFKGSSSLPIELKFPSPTDEAKKVKDIFIDYFSGKTPIQVTIKSNEE
ncbi:MAG: hypothetical protein KDC90_12745 [Ignavibacteriae bacterium]|nr:hypothetical protein [Ignavibacteriota bacterium]MCB9211502.1 hypothetical protein [Ignavibacteriales bacterium]